MNNENIGAIGEAFIQSRLTLGIDFDAAWDEWQEIQAKLMFVAVDCPEVQLYDDRRVSDRRERQRIRRLAKEKLGDHIRSADVSLLGGAAEMLAVEIPVRPYRMERTVVQDFLTNPANGFSEEFISKLWMGHIEYISTDVERFAEEHCLWAVPNESVVEMYFNHRKRLLTTTCDCAKCGSEIEILVDHSAGRWQHFTKKCQACKCDNTVAMTVNEDGEAEVLGVAVET